MQTINPRTMLHDNATPRYLPHLEHPQVLQMGLAPLGDDQWIETDNHIGQYHRHKLLQRQLHGDAVYRCTPGSVVAQQELARLLLSHLSGAQADLYHQEGDTLRCIPGDFRVPLSAPESLWNCSLWVADDLVIMEKADGEYRLTAASLCSPSHWRLAEKFDRPLREIHDPIPGFHQALTPRIDRFFDHLRAEHPVVRGNWALQGNDQLNPTVVDETGVDAATPLYYRSERQSLLRLPATDAIAFTIRVYLHPLDCLWAVPNALPALLDAIDQTPPALAHYKGFDKLAPALAKYRTAGAPLSHDVIRSALDD